MNGLCQLLLGLIAHNNEDKTATIITILIETIDK